ncbi:uncharacterized protein AMSG_05304 [Thecamonas trahens ATCC 50062]|uniref:Integral membrane protein n=1 Tax=Thecamonas trahens ATCC 50062 TaxID=461836 RepID=A0A0L0DB32_THETB|nr:integral membrane protein [Thecamonas trahens ATCC 50062]KNC49306.1 integral membrane protein [Thecamonas trahens ATCC 50062]|eukprot:XP_013758016.1 integral membrane protein [Thecamonas trahens ATCC 50062]
MLRLYMAALERSPLLTKMLTCAVLNATEETLGQILATASARDSSSIWRTATSFPGNAGQSNLGSPIRSPGLDGRDGVRAGNSGNERTVSVARVVAEWLDVAKEKALAVVGANIGWLRVAKMGAYGALINAPLNHVLYGAADVVFTNLTSSSITNMSLHLAAVNIFIIPIVTYVYLYALGTIEGLSRDDLQARIFRDFVPIVKQTWTYFPIIQLIVFKFAPAQLTVPIFNLIGFVYGVYINATSKTQ